MSNTYSPTNGLYCRSFVWNYFKKKGSKAKCDFCGTELVYQDGTTSNLKKHLKIHKSRVPELTNESKVKQGGVTIIEMLNNKASVS